MIIIPDRWVSRLTNFLQFIFVIFGTGSNYHKHVELYDLDVDPWEMNNLSNSEDHQSILKDLLKNLFNQMKETEDPILKGDVMSPHHEKTMEIMITLDKL